MVLALVASACGQQPEREGGAAPQQPPAGSYKTDRYDVTVDDPTKDAPLTWVDDVIDATANRAMVVDKDDVAKVYARMPAMTVHIVRGDWAGCPGHDAHADGDYGCTLDNEIWIAWRPCMDPSQSAPEILAHEIGHAVGHGGHSFTKWFGGAPDSGVPVWVEFAVCTDPRF